MNLNYPHSPRQLGKVGFQPSSVSDSQPYDQSFNFSTLNQFANLGQCLDKGRFQPSSVLISPPCHQYFDYTLKSQANIQQERDLSWQQFWQFWQQLNILAELQSKTLLIQYTTSSFTQSHHSVLPLNCDIPSFRELRQTQPIKFRQLIDFLEDSDFAGISNVWSQSFIDKITYIISNWKQFAPSYRDSLKLFLKTIKQTVASVPLYEQVYPGMSSLITKLQFRLQMRQPRPERAKSKSQAQKDSLLRNKLFQNIQVQHQSRANKQGSYFVREQQNESVRKPLGGYIVQKKLYLSNLNNWKRIMHIAAANKRYKQGITQHKEMVDQINSVYQFAQLSLSNNQLTQPCNQLCCAKFFYMNFNVQPLEDIHLICKAKLEQLQPPKSQEEAKKEKKGMKKNEIPEIVPLWVQETMLDICALLNRGGGVILFNVEQQYLQFRPICSFPLKNEMMPQYIKLIDKQLKNIKPQIKHGREVVITFVPLVLQPYQYGYNRETLNQDDRRTNRKYIEGAYVLRIAVVPSQREKLHFYFIDKNQIKTAVMDGRARRILQDSQIYQQIKKKFQFYYLDAADQDQRELLERDFTYIQKNHKCVPPYPGLPLYVITPLPLPEPPKFRYMSLVVAKKEHRPIIKYRLKLKGIECQISDQLQKYEFKSSANSAPIFHNVRFDQLLAEIAYKPQFQFNGKFLLVVMVTSFIKFADRLQNNYLSIQDYDNLKKWLKIDFPNETLSYYTFENDQKVKEHYLHTQSKLSTVLMYYVLHHHNEKILLKDPKKIGSMSKLEKENRFKKIYPKTQDSSPSQSIGNQFGGFSSTPDSKGYENFQSIYPQHFSLQSGKVFQPGPPLFKSK